MSADQNSQERRAERVSALQTHIEKDMAQRVAEAINTPGPVRERQEWDRPAERLARDLNEKAATNEPRLPLHAPPLRSNVQRFSDRNFLPNPDREANQIMREIEDEIRQGSLTGMDEPENER